MTGRLMQAIRSRNTAKLYDPSRKISQRDIDDLLEVLRLAPSAVNIQPWHYFVTASRASREKLLAAMDSYNLVRVSEASLVIVFAVREKVDETLYRQILEQEEKDGRYPIGQGTDRGRRSFIERNHSADPAEQFDWMARQAYIAMGFLLMAAAIMGIDATPIEGMSAAKVDEILNLRSQGLRSVAAVSLGYRAADDPNAAKPKSRLKADQIFTWF